jgi:hypothetical protein
MAYLLFEYLLSFTIADFRKQGILKEGEISQGVLNWEKGEIIQGSIGFTLDMAETISFLELQYIYNGVPKLYTVELEKRVSNLGKGLIWYFKCSETGKLCRKLYFFNGQFVHRIATKNCYYEKQVQSRLQRDWLKAIRGYKILDELLEVPKQKHFKAYYNGNKTKKYLKLELRTENIQLPTFSLIDRYLNSAPQRNQL